jgi:thiamine transport system permease protein
VARRTQQLSAGGAAGGLALALVAGLTLAPLGALLLAAGGGAGGRPALGPADLAAIRFTLLQATLSALLSGLLAVPLARALARRTFFGRGLLLALIGAPFLLPALVAILGLTAVWGRSGLLSEALAAAGLGRLDIYGLAGVVLGHVFFNLPLVTRLLLQGWGAVPAEHWRLVAGLGMPPGAVFRVIEAPMLRERLPGAMLLVFLLCTTSFAVALALGGGPAASTVELAIFQAVRFDFDLGRAGLLALVQSGLCLATGLALLALGRAPETAPGLDRAVCRLDAPGGPHRLADAAVLGAAGLFLGAPLAMVVLHGLPALAGGLPESVGTAALLSLAVALPSALAAVLLALAIGGLAAGSGRGWLAEAAGLLALAASPFAVGTGLFLLVSPVADPFALALPVTGAINALMALPFALRILVPALAAVRRDFGPLADSLGIAGGTRFRIVTWPRIRRPAGFAAGLAAALAMGDLGVIALFDPADMATLPLAVYRLMEAYRIGAAQGAALLLLGLSLGLFWLFERGGRALDRA